MTETSPESLYERVADMVEENVPPEALFDPLETMDSIKWETVLDRHYRQFTAGERKTIADILESRYFKGCV